MSMDVHPDDVVADAVRCPLDGAVLRSWTHEVNADSTYVHLDGTTHGGLLAFAEQFNAKMAALNEALAPVVAELNAAAQRGMAAARAIEWPIPNWSPSRFEYDAFVQEPEIQRPNCTEGTES